MIPSKLDFYVVKFPNESLKESMPPDAATKDTMMSVIDASEATVIAQASTHVDAVVVGSDVLSSSLIKLSEFIPPKVVQLPRKMEMKKANKDKRKQ